jgi:hypothetical protein
MSVYIKGSYAHATITGLRVISIPGFKDDIKIEVREDIPMTKDGKALFWLSQLVRDASSNIIHMDRIRQIRKEIQALQDEESKLEAALSVFNEQDAVEVALKAQEGKA